MKISPVTTVLIKLFFLTNAAVSLTQDFTPSIYVTEKEEGLTQVKEEAVAVMESLVPPPVIDSEEQNSGSGPPEKRAKGLVAILQHSLGSAPEEDICAEDKVERELKR